MTQRAHGVSPAARAASCVVLLCCLVASVFLTPMVALADGGIALGGTFYTQDLEIALGAEVSSPSIYVTVFNEGDETATFGVSSESPSGVELLFSENEFDLTPGEGRQVFITVRVREDAAPGQYQLVVRAQQIAAETPGEIAMVAAATQRADLTIVGESGKVRARSVSPDGDEVVARLGLYRDREGNLREYAVSETGALDAQVSPGRYVVIAYVDGIEVAQENIEVVAGQIRQVAMTVRTVHFGGVGVVENRFADSGELAHAEIVYTINNLYRKMDDVEVILRNSLNGEVVEELSLLSLGSLDTGRTGGRYSFVPAQGWASGTYAFDLLLYAGDTLYAQASTEDLVVEVAPPVNYALIAGVAAALCVAAVGVYLYTKRRTPGPE